ncbi:U5 small nuclear ribonucleoprotein TSSC4-like [Brachyistius frenatus]|uniref:U5 small nuclear ribonucleoprotein TSSC4-like n=1 Tax=Brachyistius frenatus TaxID=100188 RepID=UPI0037E741AC
MMCDETDRDRDTMLDSDEFDPEEAASRAPFDPELDHSDDGEAELCAPAAVHAPQSSFSLSGGSSAFSDRSHSIFDLLDSVDHRTLSSPQQSVPDGTFAPPKPPDRKTSRPPSGRPTPPKKRGVPDYLVHPERWTHYSLEDVPETSDEDNCRAAHVFLSGLQPETRKDSSRDKVVFRPKRRKMDADQLSADRGKERGMHLSHLEDEEEDEEKEEEEEEEDEEENEEEDKGTAGEEAGGRRTEQSVVKTEEGQKLKESGGVGRAVGRAVGGAVGRAVGGAEEKEQGQKDNAIKGSSFTCIRNTKGKNYRKSSGHEDN